VEVGCSDEYLKSAKQYLEKRPWFGLIGAKYFRCADMQNFGWHLGQSSDLDDDISFINPK
jgi:hypothetical protein